MAISYIPGSDGPIFIPGFPYDATAQGYVNRSFGLFLSFNMSTFNSTIAGSEQADPNESPNTFNPGSTCSPQQWVNTALAARAKYMILTFKHHDGFKIWRSTNAHKIQESSWYAANGSHDIGGEWIAACKVARIVPIVYYSIWDKYWELTHDPNDSAAYQAYCEGEITEIITNYGPIGGLWLDGTKWHFSGKANGYPWASAAARNAFIHGLQSTCMVIDNGHVHSMAATDVDPYEGGAFGGEDVPGGNTTTAEMADTIRGDGAWFYHVDAQTPKTSATIISAISTYNGRNASYALDVPPDNTGVIPSSLVTIMNAVGLR